VSLTFFLVSYVWCDNTGVQFENHKITKVRVTTLSVVVLDSKCEGCQNMTLH
jgi:hypothetical protein